MSEFYSLRRLESRTVKEQRKIRSEARQEKDGKERQEISMT
jgi:hypothetical protein